MVCRGLTKEKGKDMFRENRKKILVGIILATISTCLLWILDGSIKATIVIVVLYLIVTPLRFKLSDKILNYIYIIYFIVASFITVFLSQMVLNEGIYYLGILEIILGMVLCNIICLVFLGLTMKCRLSVILGSTIGMILTTVNYFVYTFRGSELMPADFLSMTTALNVVDNYNFEITQTVIYSWVFFVFFSYSSFCLPDLYIERNCKKYLQVLMIEGILLCSFIFLGGEIETWQWKQKGSRLNGYLLNFSLQLRETFVMQPENYSIDNIKLLSDKYTNKTNRKGSEEYPDIIVIMDESFVDLDILGSKIRTNDDITPYMDSLEENIVKGYALSSVFGGSTPNSEYEFLTGNTMGFLPSGSIAYQQFINDEQFSIVSNLKKWNYSCVSMHPYLADGWERPAVYSDLGFEKCYFLDDFPQKKIIRDYVSDQEMFEQIIKQYENKEEEKNLFLYSVSMQNHGGYETEEFDSTIYLQDYSQEYSDVEEYLSLIHETDLAMEYLIKYFENVENDVVIVFYGDHFPSLNPKFYEEVHGGGFDTLDEQMLQQKVPFMIWTNYDIEEKFIECTSLNYLSNFLYNIAGIPLPQYNQFLEDMQKTIPAMNSKGFYSLEKGCYLSYDKASENEKKMLNQYEQLQYNCLFDKKNRSEEFFPLR